MKAKSRRRLLVSSVAMLLVAMLALGTATFAWFTTNTTSYADEINATTTKASTLVISKSDKDWKTHVQYGFGTTTAEKIMYPASSVNGTNWWKADAIDGTGAVKIDTLKAATGTDYVFKEELNVKNDGAAKVTQITIKFSNLATASDYARVALVAKGDADSKVKTTNGTFTSSVYAKDSEVYKPINAGGTAVDTTEIKCNGTCTVNVPELGAGEMAYYDLYVWFEGQDKDCTNANSGQKIPDLRFDVTGTPATE